MHTNYKPKYEGNALIPILVLVPKLQGMSTLLVLLKYIPILVVYSVFDNFAKLVLL